MAPIRSHIILTKYHVLSIRTFLNKKQIQKNMVKHPILMGSGNIDKEKEKLIQLSKCKRIIISNRHLRELYNDPKIKEKIICVLLEMSKEEIFSICLNNSNSNSKSNNNVILLNDSDFINRNDNLNTNSFKDSEILYIPFGNDSWKCRLCISWNDIENLRGWLCGVEKHNGRTNWNNFERLMIRNLKFSNNNYNNCKDKVKEIVEFFDNSDNENEEITSKKNLTYEYDKILLSPIAINVHIYSKN